MPSLYLSYFPPTVCRTLHSVRHIAGNYNYNLNSFQVQLEIVWPSKAARGFESLPLRQNEGQTDAQLRVKLGTRSPFKISYITGQPINLVKIISRPECLFKEGTILPARPYLLDAHPQLEGYDNPKPQP